MVLISVCVVKHWQLAQDLMLFDHQGPVSKVGPLGSQHNHHTALRGNKVCLCEHMKKKCFICRCASASAFVSVRSTCVCVFLRHLRTHRSGSSSEWQWRPYAIVRL